MKTLILGLGNPLLGDDGVGWRVVEQVQQRIAPSIAEIDYHAGGGLALMERLIGYDRVLIVDALTTGQRATGAIDCFRLNDLPPYAASHLSSAHETDLQTALAVGKQMGAILPGEILIIGIEANQVYDFSETLSPAVAEAVAPAARAILAYLFDN
jgi:hydrogenase maturation protease